MKVIIPVVNCADKREVLSNGFVEGGGLCVYHIDSGKSEWIDAKSVKQSNSTITDLLHEWGVSSVVATELSHLALSMFITSGFEVFKAEGFDLNSNVKSLVNGELSYFGFHAAFRRSCDTSKCGSCSSACAS